MTAHPGLVLMAAAGVLAAVDMPTWRELTALGLVALVLRWLIARENRREGRDDRRLRRLERQVRGLSEEAAQQRSLKHEFNNQLLVLRNVLEVVKIHARRCSCGALAPALQLLEEVTTHDPHP